MTHFKIKAGARLAIATGCLAASVIWLAIGLRVLPDPRVAQAQQRLRVCEALAMTSTAFIRQRDFDELANFLQKWSQRQQDLTSLILRPIDEAPVVQIGPHDSLWRLPAGAPSTLTNMRVALVAEGKHWGDLEVSFRESSGGWVGMLSGFPIALIVFCSGGIILLNWFYLSRTLQYLNPSKVVPSRVRSALDALSEGLALIDDRGRIVLANKAFGEIARRSPEMLQGRDPGELPWSFVESSPDEGFPWQRCLTEQIVQAGTVLALKHSEVETRRFIVNASPIFADREKLRGALISFDDVTALETKREELASMLQVLRASREEIQRKNAQLQRLASYDPLSQCFNRWAFFERFKEAWSNPDQQPLSMIMVDLDHFKSINDRYGHSAGDSVIRLTGGLLKELVGDEGWVCRFGGEEFSIGLVKCDYAKALEMAERIRVRLQDQPMEQISVTASIGVSCRTFGAMDPQHLLDQADQALYQAKRQGRNRVIGWENCPKQTLADAAQPAPAPALPNQPGAMSPRALKRFVEDSLIVALAYRDSETAEHSRRVAELAAVVADSWLDSDQTTLLQIAALLHDIGKIGVPDAVLHKPGPLDSHEQEVMHRHDEVSCHIVESSLGNEQVAQIIRLHSIPYEQLAIQATEDSIMVAATILAACDAFDAMTSPSVYRQALSREAAVMELHRCAGRQFHPDVIDRLATVVREREALMAQVAAQLAHNPDEDGFQLGPTDLVHEHVNHLVASLSRGDLSAVRDHGQRLQQAAAADRKEPVEQAAARLNEALSRNDAQLDRVLQMTQELLDCCRDVHCPREDQELTLGMGVSNSSYNESHPDLLPLVGHSETTARQESS